MEFYMYEHGLIPKHYGTYEKNPYVGQNTFIGKEKVAKKLPTYEEVYHKLPKPIFDGHDDYIKAYESAWKIAFGNLGSAADCERFISDFIKTAFNSCLFMWDSSFIQMYAKYANNCFPF
jgi:hypothetical protein